MRDLNDRTKGDTSKQSKPEESRPGDIAFIEFALRLSQSLKQAGLLCSLDRLLCSVCCLLSSVLSTCDCRPEAAQGMSPMVAALQT